MTGPAVGTQTVFGMSAVEGAYGTPSTVNRFTEILNETLELKPGFVESNGLRGGSRNLRRASRRVITDYTAVGDVNLEVPTTGLGRIINAIMGGAAVTTALGGSPAAFQHVFALASVLGKSYTLQKQLRDPAAALLQTLTYPGAKVMDAEFTIAAKGLLLLKLTIDAQNERDDIAAAAASYTNQKLFHFRQATLSVDATPAANVGQASVKFTNPEKIDRFFLGSSGLKAEPVDSDFPAVSGQLTAEVLDAVLYGKFKNNTAAALQLEFVGDVISGLNSEALIIDVPAVFFTGKTPTVPGFGVIENQIPWEARADSGGDPGATITLITTDATP